MFHLVKRQPILNLGQLKRLKEHKYSSTNSSFCDGVLQYWWNWLVLQVPLWLAPNLITILGLIVNIGTSCILVYYSPDCKGEVPSWACYLCALGLFTYQSLDAIDGKQARRTGTSSPLGELFDHGCDSISTVFVSVAICVSLQLGSAPKLMFLQCFCAITMFYCAHWQTYVSGTLRFGRIDVTEAQMGFIGMHIVSGYLGCGWWTNSTVLGIPYGWLVTPLALPIAIWSLVQTLKVIFTGGVGKNGSTVAGSSVLSPVIPFCLVLFPAMMIAGNGGSSGTYALSPALYILTFGLIGAKVTNRLVVAHMTKSEMEYMDSSLLGPFLLFMNQYFGRPLAEQYLLYFSLLWVCIDLWFYCRSVCKEICAFLGIQLFRIPPTSHQITQKTSSSQSSASATSSRSPSSLLNNKKN